MIHNNGRAVLKHYKRRFDVRHVEIHHIIPKQFEHHPILKSYDYDTEARYNLMFMPDKSSYHPMRRVHTGGHMYYNKFVETTLPSITSGAALIAFVAYLRHGCRNKYSIPWKSEVGIL